MESTAIFGNEDSDIEEMERVMEEVDSDGEGTSVVNHISLLAYLPFTSVEARPTAAPQARTENADDADRREWFPWENKLVSTAQRCWYRYGLTLALCLIRPVPSTS